MSESEKKKNNKRNNKEKKNNKRNNKEKNNKGSILVICAHSDDQIIGVGGTMAKYAKEGYDVHTIILSFGESVKPHVKREIIAKTRIKEAQRADKIIGGKSVTFIGLRENHFEEDFKRRGIDKNLKKIIRKLRPAKIFTHSGDDAHPDHRATFRIVLRMYKESKLNADLYAFEVWHLFNIKKRNKPKLVVDTSNTFKTKMKALKTFKSQIDLSTFYNYLVLNNFLFFTIYIRDLINGIKHSTKYAEVFYKVR
ncbi:MAG TPA: PIG-L family deacetylase [Candidatus Woesearchaeota archaeon]|nr:PIG-L family deacetylase [Candidatus Woesearchaeota archaeon]